MVVLVLFAFLILELVLVDVPSVGFTFFGMVEMIISSR